MLNMKKTAVCLTILLFLLPAGMVYAGTGSPAAEPAASSRAITASDLVWPMFGKDKEHTFIAAPAVKGIFTPAEKWGADQQIDSLGAAIGNFEANIFGTYDKDVNFVVFAETGYIYIVDGETGETAWLLDCDGIDSTDDNDMVFTSPAIGDLNKNGKMDVVFAVDDAANNSNVYAYEPVIQYTSNGYDIEDENHTSEQLWEYSTSVDMSYSSPVLSDLDTDGNLDVIIGGADGSAYVYAIHGKDGKALSGWPYSMTGIKTSTPAIYTFGPNPRVVITSIDLDNYYVYVVSDSGQTLHQKTIDMGLIAQAFSVIPSPAIGQLNRSSSRDEIAICVPSMNGNNGRVYSLSHNLSTEWMTTYTQGPFESSPSLVDINGDMNGDMDVVVASWDNFGFGANVYAIEGRTGAEIWHQFKNLGVSVQSIIASPALVDVNTDTNVDGIFVAQDTVFALNGTNGGFLWNFSLPEPTGARLVRSSPAVGDVDKDKFLDIFIDGSLISHYIIDLTLTPDDVEFSESEFIQGKETSITAIIHNIGQAEAENVVVTFMENSLYIDNATIGSIPGGDTRGATIQWTPEVAGKVTLKISVDPDNTIEEVVENNNEISLVLDIIPAFPDISFDELRFYRGDGKLVDNINTHLIENEESRVAAVVHNIGGLKAENVVVKFREGSLNLGVDQLIGFLGVNKTIEVGLNWTPAVNYHTIDAFADPDDAIAEVNESNNNIRKIDLYVKSVDPGDASFVVSGKVFMPDGVTLATGVAYTITNERTQSFMKGTTSSSGRYSRDLKELPNRYREGDRISVYVTDGTNESLIDFKAYSEDISRQDNITLSTQPRYSIKLSTADDAKEIDPGSQTDYIVQVENKGNTNNTITLNHTSVIDVNTNLPAVNWSVGLDAYSVDDLSAGGSRERRLTVRAPSKASEATAGQVVRITVSGQSEQDRSQTDSVTFYATLTRKYQIDLEASPAFLKFDPAQSTVAEITLNISNLGNGPDNVRISTSNVTLDAVSIDIKSPIEIDTGASVQEMMVIKLADSHQPGLFYLTVHARSEDGSSSQLRHLTVQVVRPDLAVSGSDVELPSTLPGIGETLTVTIKVYNNGTAPANSVGVFLLDEGETIAFETVAQIGENSVKYVYLSFILTKEGLYNLKILADPDNLIIESNEDNNEASFSFGVYPDLGFASSILMNPGNPKNGDKVTLSVTLINLGQVDVSRNFKVEFYFYRSGNRIRLKDATITDSLNSGGSYDLVIEWEAQRDVSTVYCMVDSGRAVYESNEGNNEIMLNISVAPGESTSTEDSGLAYTILGGIVFLAIIIIIMYLLFMPPRDEEEEDEDEKPGPSGKTKDVKRKTSEPESKKSKDDEEVEEVEEEEEDESIIADLVGGVKSLNPFAPPPEKKKKKVVRKKPASAKDVLEKKELKERPPDKLKPVPKDEAMEKIKKADTLIKTRELSDREKLLDRRKQILSKKERELMTMKDDLVEIGILEAEAIDDLEKEEVGIVDEDEAVEVEPIE